MSTNENKDVELADREALRKLITDLEAKLDDLYARSDKLTAGVSQCKEALEKVRQKRVKLLKNRLQKLFAQWNIQPSSSHHQPSALGQSQNPGQGQNQTQGGTMPPPLGGVPCQGKKPSIDLTLNTLSRSPPPLVEYLRYRTVTLG
ncbi:hypothetical protein FSARC_1482 [Fusarium sarcochroum]|uniref:Uncharacterized protein n=1 Tax=Fusarium sarcochroum TaxID=1208366 RepID=A0A8H4U8X7_9HYPO|nr:hypothetical protein FSARC_1482 [Fusarium sarcochroum]